MASTRNIGLDYLRSLAIVIVLFNHGLIGFFFGTSILKIEGPIVSISAASIISIEWLFVLSGFLIGTMMIRSFDGDRKWLQCAKVSGCVDGSEQFQIIICLCWSIYC